MRWFVGLAPVIGGMLELAAAALNVLGAKRDLRRNDQGSPGRDNDAT